MGIAIYRTFLAIVVLLTLGIHLPAIEPGQGDQIAAPGQPGFVYGIDIAHYDGDVVNHLSQRDEIEFAICKATEGVTYTDPDFGTNWEVLDSKGLIRGAYHFYRSNDPPIDQARLFLKTCGDLRPIDLPPILDIEASSVVDPFDPEQFKKDVLAFLQFIESQTQRKPIIYTGFNFGQQYLGDASFARYPLWIAEYSKSPEPKIPFSWKGVGYAFWQRSESYRLDSREVDFDVFQGNKSRLLEFIEGH